MGFLYHLKTLHDVPGDTENHQIPKTVPWEELVLDSSHWIAEKTECSSAFNKSIFAKTQQACDSSELQVGEASNTEFS